MGKFIGSVGGDGGRLPALSVDEVRKEVGSPKAMRTVMTIERAQVVKFVNDVGREQSFLAVRFEEMPGFELKCNVTQAKAFEALVIAGVLSDQQDDLTGLLPKWVGVRIPLVVQNTTWRGEMYEKWYPAPASDYHRLLDEHDGGDGEGSGEESAVKKTAARKTAAKKTAAKKTTAPRGKK